jgi:hypothetical protein
LPPYFESFSIFYPSNPAATDRATLFSEDGDRQVSYFGTKGDLDRMLTIANSGGLMNHLIQKFDLVNHYKMDTTNAKYLFYVGREFQGNYEAIKTDRDAIQIKIQDKNPKMASDMVNEAVQYINEVNNSMIRDNKNRTIDILKTDLEAKEILISKLNADLEVGTANERVYLQSRLTSLTEEINALQKLYDQYKIESAQPALTKSKPVRWMICAFAAIGSFVFAVLLVIFLEKFKEVKANA